jgi:hypothetical protein
MIIKSICGCVSFEVNPKPYPYTYPIRIKNTMVDIYKHEASCEKSELAWKGHLSIKDKLLVHQSLDGPYPYK